MLVDYDIFVKVPKLDAKDLATVQRLYKAEDVDFALQAGIGRRRSRGGAAERHRRLHRRGAGSGCAGGRQAPASLRTAAAIMVTG